MLRHLALLAAVALRAAAQLAVTTFPSTAFAPGPGAASTVPSLDLRAAVAPPFSSVRFGGTIAAAAAQTVTFSLLTDGAVRLWVGDWLVVDASDAAAAPRTLTAFPGVPFAGAGAPLPLRLEYVRGGAAAPAASALVLSWAGNFTPAAVVPPSAFSPAVAPSEARRQELKDRMLSPAVQWQTYWNPSMGTHVRMPAGFALDATLADLATGAVLGEIIVFPRQQPAITLVGPHSHNGSDYTSVRLDAWLGRACSVVIESTVVGAGADLYLLTTASGAGGCEGVALMVSGAMLWGRAGAVAAAGPGAILATAPGLPNTTAWAVGAAPSRNFNGSAPGPFRGAPGFVLPLAATGVAGVSTGGSAPADVATMRAAIDAAAARQAAALAKWGAELSDVYEPMQTVIAWNTVFSPYEGVVTPVSRGWDFGWGYVLFEWDNYFLAYMASLDTESLDVAYSNLIQLTLGRTMEGFVPNHVSGPEKDVGITEPYVGARIVLSIFKRWGDAWVVDLIIDALLTWNDWLWRRRRGEGIFAGADGLADLMVLGSDPNFSAFPVNGGLNALQDARYESGLDNSPLVHSTRPLNICNSQTASSLTLLPPPPPPFPPPAPARSQNVRRR